MVVAPNPTGSTGFGDKLTDMIQNNWGSYPYDDLVKCWEHVHDNFDFIDTDNGVAAGASYGGFMVNWIQGNPLGRKFKALVTHDGTFVADAKVSTDELWFIEHDVCPSLLLMYCVAADFFLVQWHLLGQS